MQDVSRGTFVRRKISRKSQLFHVEHSEVGLIGAMEFVPRGTFGNWLVLNLRRHDSRECST